MFRHTHRLLSMLRDGARRLATARILLVWPALSACLAAAVTAEAAPPAPVPWTLSARGDAALLDLCFLDARQGWVVGERGTILHTDDGGRRWTMQESGVACRLASVHFIDERHGWAAGGWTEPLTHVSHGVILRTTDGGRTWQAAPAGLLPEVRQVRFFDRRRGIAVAKSSALFPSGIFHTTDGGQSWSPMSGRWQGEWLAGEFQAPDAGLLVGRGGLTARLHPRQVEPNPPLDSGLRDPAAVRSRPDRRGWLVGDGGLLRQTDDGGRTWTAPDAELPAGAELCDFRAVCIVEESIWIAGSPGSRVLHSGDGGRSFQWQNTGQTLPLAAVRFVDRRTGWAVGSLGTILHSDDGGQSWQRQRDGGRRAAWLALVATADNMPPEMIAHWSAGEGYLGVVQELGRRDWESPQPDPQRSGRHREAVIAAGAADHAAAWQFPLRQAGLQLSAEKTAALWARRPEESALTRMEEYLVRQIRLWRPEVVLTEPASPRGEDPAAHLINQLVLRAVVAAADPHRFPEHRTELDLPAWEVPRTCAVVRPGERAALALHDEQWVPRLGVSLRDFTMPIRGLYDARSQRTPTEFGVQMLIDRTPPAAGRRDLFGGLGLRPGGEARRAAGEPPATEVNMLQRLAEQRRQVRAILDAAEDDPRGGTAWLEQVVAQGAHLDADSAAWMLHRLAQRHVRHGKIPAAAETFQLLAQRYPRHPAGGHALLWLVHFHAGEEPARRGEAAGRPGLEHPEVRTVAALEPLPEDAPAGETEVLPPEQAAALPARAARDPRLAAALEAAGRLERNHPAVAAAPQVGFPLAAARRRGGQAAEAERFYQGVVRGGGDELWQRTAEAELWLKHRQGPPPKPVWTVGRTAEKPLLDGKLDEAFWRRQQALPLRSHPPGDDLPDAVVLAAYDHEYLYLAVRCRRPAGQTPQAADGAARRDESLSGQDRVQLLLDVDRGYATWYTLEVDHRGHARDSCWNDPGWNPTWYLAHHQDRSSWTCEIAVPLAELTSAEIGGQTAWAVGVQRIVPGQGFQSWQPQAAIEGLPQGFGLLLFAD